MAENNVSPVGFRHDNICRHCLNMIVEYSCVYFVIKTQSEVEPGTLRFDVCDVGMFLGTQHSEQRAHQRQSVRIDR